MDVILPTRKYGELVWNKREIMNKKLKDKHYQSVVVISISTDDLLFFAHIIIIYVQTT